MPSVLLRLVVTLPDRKWYFYQSRYYDIVPIPEDFIQICGHPDPKHGDFISQVTSRKFPMTTGQVEIKLAYVNVYETRADFPHPDSRTPGAWYWAKDEDGDLSVLLMRNGWTRKESAGGYKPEEKTHA